MSLNDRISSTQEREPQEGDRVRIGPASVPSHEWIGLFLRWADPYHEHLYVIHPTEGRQRIKVEALRGIA